jgi:hypothetical protein
VGYDEVILGIGAWLDASAPMITVDLNTLDGSTLTAMRPRGTYYSWENYKRGGIGYNDAGYHVEYEDSDGVQQIFPLAYATRTAAMLQIDELAKPSIAQRISTEMRDAATSIFAPPSVFASITDAIKSVEQTVTGTTGSNAVPDVSTLWNSIKWYLVIIVVVVAAFILLAVRLNRPSITVGRMK